MCMVHMVSEDTYAFDFDAYMEQAAVWLGRPRHAAQPGPFQWDYAELRGDTGPLVYPAGHLYLHSALLSAFKWNVTTWTTESVPKQLPGYEDRVQRPASALHALQGLYAVLWLILCASVYSVYQSMGAFDSTWRTAWYLVLLSATRRGRSVFVLGLFGDAWCMTLLWLSFALLAKRKWTIGSIVYSCAVAVKMNALLAAPGLLAVYLRAGGAALAVRQIAICAAVQLLLGAPFLLFAPWSYLTRAFDLSRQFDQQWSVNWRWLPPWLFHSKAFAAALLLAQLACLALLSVYLWKPAVAAKPQPQTALAAKLREETVAEPADAEQGSSRPADMLPAAAATPPPAARARRRLTVAHASPTASTPSSFFSGKGDATSGAAAADGGQAWMGAALLTSLFLGTAFARSLHFQFHVWYWHLLPFLVSHSYGLQLPPPLQLLVMVVVEYAWSRHPPDAAGSLTLTLVHALLVACLMARALKPAAWTRLTSKAEQRWWQVATCCNTKGKRR